MPRSAIIFDLDGTLVHSSPDIAHHLNVALMRLKPGMEALAVRDVETLIGGGMEELVRRGLNVLDLDTDPDVISDTISFFRDAYEEEPVIHTTLYPGVVALLETLRTQGHVIGLCTNKRERTAHLVLNHFGLSDQFDVVIGGDTTPERKPSPLPLNETAKRLDLEPSSIVMVGDSKADFGSARAAGTHIIMVDWGYTDTDPHHFGADAVISSYAEFLPHLSSILSS